MPWYILVFSRVITAYIVVPTLIKINTGLPSVKRRLLWQYSFCLIFSIIYMLIVGFTIQISSILIAGIGFITSFGTYAQWRAIDISLSKTSLFTQADDSIAIILGYWLLHETKYLNAWLFIGVVFCFIGGALLMNKESNFRLIRLVAFYSVIWGIASFLIRWFNLNGIQLSEFLVYFYSGTFLGALGIFLLKKDKALTIKLSFKEIRLVGLLAIFVWLSLLLAYCGAKLAPITAFQPIYLISEAIAPIIIGLWIFKERKELAKKEWLALIIGVVGIILIAYSYR